MTWDYAENENIKIRIDWVDRGAAVQYFVKDLDEADWENTPFETYEFWTAEQALHQIEAWLDY